MCKILILSLSFVFFSTSVSAQTAEIVFSKSQKSAEAVTEFKSGEFIFAHIKLSKPLSGVLTFTDKPVTLIAEYHSKGKMIDDEMFGFEAANIKNSKQTTIILPVISDTSNDVTTFGKNLFAVRLPATLAKLSDGKHEIEYKLNSYNFKDGSEPVAVGKFTLLIQSGAKVWYAQNEKDAMAGFSKRGITSVNVSARDAAMGVVGGTSVVTLVNNCGKSVWLRKAIGSDKTEYRLSPGQTMKYDRDSGYLEEWNFGTKKWNTVTKVWNSDANGKANICTK